MNRDPYQILGVSRTATDDEIRAAYRELTRKYHPDRYGADNPLSELATEKMQEINEAYEAILSMRAGGRPFEEPKQETNGYGSNQGGSSSHRNDDPFGYYAEIRQLLNAKRYSAAEAKLEGIAPTERTADWHYLKSVTLMRRGWINDAMHELETACQMDPANIEYQQAKEMFNRTARGYGSTYYNEGQYQRGGGCCDADFCTTLCCMNLLCDICGGGCG